MIATAIDSLNAAFADICVSFKVCEERTIENFQYDSIDSLAQWEDLLVKEHQPNRINIFLVTSSVLDPVSPQEECGFATPSGIASLETGGMVMHKECLALPDVLIHLAGHYFGLIHTFEGNGSEFVNGSNCASEGDLICDTPADNYLPPSNIFNNNWIDRQETCRFINAETDDNQEFYRPHVGNYMSYYFDAATGFTCRCGFSHQQYLKMAETYSSSDPKMW